MYPECNRQSQASFLFHPSLCLWGLQWLPTSRRLLLIRTLGVTEDTWRKTPWEDQRAAANPTVQVHRPLRDLERFRKPSKRRRIFCRRHLTSVFLTGSADRGGVTVSESREAWKLLTKWRTTPKDLEKRAQETATSHRHLVSGGF